MNRTGLDTSALSRMLRRMAGDGSIEWVMEPIQASVLLDMADSLDENAKLREQMERLLTLLRVDCDIDASFDGLRRFWVIGLTEDGRLMRDRACDAEVENAKLRELAKIAWGCVNRHVSCDECRMSCGGCTLQSAMHELGIEVDR